MCQVCNFRLMQIFTKLVPDVKEDPNWLLCYFQHGGSQLDV
jgi:hypothetical protein